MVLLIAWSGMLVSAAALGQPAAALTLRWSAPAGCPQQSDVRDRIRKLTGATNSTATVLQAEGTITQTDAAHFHLKLVTRSGALVGERNLDASSCENLSGAAAISIALLLRSEEPLSAGDLAGQPVAGTTTGAPAPSSSNPSPATATRTQPETPSTKDMAEAKATAKEADEADEADETDEADEADETTQRPLASSKRKWRVIAQLPLATLSIGPLPKPSWGVAFAGGVAYEKWRFSLGGSAWLRQNLATDQAPGYGADVDRLTGTLKACHALRHSALEVAPCLVLSLEHISARGTGPGITPRSEQATWLAVGAGAQGRLYLASWFSLLMGVDAQIETARPVISIDGVGNLGQLGSAALTVTLGPEWIL